MLLALAMNWPRIIHADGSCPNAELLFAHLIFIVLLAAISDVALDGLALLLLQGKNITTTLRYRILATNLGWQVQVLLSFFGTANRLPILPCGDGNIYFLFFVSCMYCH